MLFSCAPPCYPEGHPVVCYFCQSAFSHTPTSYQPLVPIVAPALAPQPDRQEERPPLR